jgi:hypothetical protein
LTLETGWGIIGPTFSKNSGQTRKTPLVGGVKLADLKLVMGIRIRSLD